MANNIFEKVLENVDIADVISRYVHLEPKGKNLFGLCPFHDDNNPSMSVSRERQIYTCFVCGKTGNAIKFIEDYKKLSSIEACQSLANEYHIDVGEYRYRELDNRQKYYELVNTASKFFQFLMNDENYSKGARTYLNNRGITDKIIQDFNIGLSSKDESALTRTLLDKKYLLPDIELNGLSNGKEDIFVNRIIVPIRDVQGRVVAFGGRIYEEKDKDLEKYRNSTDTPIFKKGELVFNLDRAKYELKDTPYLILNEGYMDVISAYSVGIKNSIALMGTKMTKNQAKLISTYTKNVCICLDSDNAGIRNVKGVIERLEEVQINVSITILKGAKDPDEFIRKYGKDKYLDAITKDRLDKVGYMYYLNKLDYPEINTFNMESFKQVVFNELKQLDKESVIEVYLKRLSTDLNISFDSIKQDFIAFRKGMPKIVNESNQINDSFKVVGARYKAEKMIIDYAIKSRTYFMDIKDYIGNNYMFMKDANLQKIFIEISDIYDMYDHHITEDVVLKELTSRGMLKDFIHDEKLDYSENDLFNRVFNYLKIEEIKEEINELLLKLKTETDKTLKGEILKEITSLKKEEKRYESKARGII